MKIQVSINLNNTIQVNKKLNTFQPKLMLLKTNWVKGKEFTKKKKDHVNKVLIFLNPETSKQE